MLSFEEIKSAIIDSLSLDLLTPKWRALLSPDDPPESGHCAVATEAFYYLAGGKEAGFMPVVCGYYADSDGNRVHEGEAPAHCHKETHWWTRGPDQNGKRGAGRLYDVTAGQYDGPFPYKYGRNTGFMQPQQIPSKRARIVMDRVIKKLGEEALEEFRVTNIRSYQNALKRNAARPSHHKAKPF